MPEKSKESRLSKYKKIDEDSNYLKLPDVGEALFIIGLAQEAGFMSSMGMGAVPISWQEIEAWERSTQRDLSIWEKLTIKDLSEAYVAELNQATAVDRPDPYTYVPEMTEVNREAVANKLLNALRSFKRNPSPPEGSKDN